jgi:hypothetical protein
MLDIDAIARDFVTPAFAMSSEGTSSWSIDGVARIHWT